MKVLGIDPGTGRFGWAIVEREKGKESLVDCGCLETPAHTDLAVRLEIIFNQLNLIIKSSSRRQLQSKTYFCHQPQDRHVVAAARGVALLACQVNKLKINSYTPLQIKSSLTGYGAADKKQVAFMVKQILKIKELPHLDDTIDAVAAALTHFSFCRC